MATFGGIDLHDPSTLSLSPDGVDLIKFFEGLGPNQRGDRVYMYDDPAGYCTIGYGHLIHHGRTGTRPDLEASFTDGLSLSEAEALLASDLNTDGGVVEEVRALMAPTELTQGMFDAYVSLVFNVGLGGDRRNWRVFQGSIAGDYYLSAMNFLNIVNAGGRRLTGLVRRRLCENHAFLTGNYSTDPSDFVDKPADWR